MNTYIDLKNQTFSFVGKGGNHRGEFQFQGNTHISSTLTGKILIEGDALLTIEKYGSIIGDVECFDLEIFGSFEGEIKSRGKVIIHPTASVKGKILAKDFSIYPGAVVNIDGITHQN